LRRAVERLELFALRGGTGRICLAETPAFIAERLLQVTESGDGSFSLLELGVRCIAAGVYDDSGKLQAGLSISAPAERMRDEWLPLLMSTASHISAALGYAARTPT